MRKQNVKEMFLRFYIFIIPFNLLYDFYFL